MHECTNTLKGENISMKIIIAPDSYKGSFSAIEVADSIERGIKNVYSNADIIKIPVADGGEGTVDALVLGTNGTYEEVEVVGPLGNKVLAKYGILNENIAVIEMAAASGLTLINKEELNPLITTTYGTGQLIKLAMEKGIRKIYLGLGGSGTNDGGVGMAQALGVSFKDKIGNEIGYGGGELDKIEEIDFSKIHPLLKETEIMVISDVQNPLCGKTGASYVYGPQKGGTKETIEILDRNLKYFGEKVKKFMGKDIMDIPGSGAAGGLGGGLIAFCDATIYSGIDKVLDIMDIDIHLKDTDLVITGEGKIDGQSVFGKVPVGVAKRAKKYDIPVIAIVGSVGDGACKVYDYGVDAIFDIIDRPMALEEAMEEVDKLIESTVTNVMRIIQLSKKFI